MFFPFHDNNPTTRTPFVTYAIIAVNAAIFWQSQKLSDVHQARFWYLRGFVPVRIAELADGKPVAVNPQEIPPPLREHLLAVEGNRIVLKPVGQGQILLSLLTCMFLHGAWPHLIVNMWFLWLFGNNVEDRLGHVTFLVFYLLGGLLASACHWVFAPDSATPVIGASGAVAAMLGAYAVTWPSARVKTLLFLFVLVTIVELPALLVLGFWFLVQLMAATNQTANLALSGGVAWWAHVGGFLAGLLFMPILSAITSMARAEPPGDEFAAFDVRELDDRGFDDDS